MTLLLGLLFIGVCWTTKDSNWAIAASVCFVAWEVNCISVRLKNLRFAVLDNKEEKKNEKNRG